MKRKDYDGEWGGDYYIQRSIGFGTLHPRQGYIKISAKLKYLVDNNPIFKLEFCTYLIKTVYPDQPYNYEFVNKDPFDDLRILFKNVMFHVEGKEVSTRYGVLMFDKLSGWPGLDISIKTDPIKYPFMVWFKNYGQMGEMVRFLKDLGFSYFNPFFNGSLKEPKEFDVPWLYLILIKRLISWALES